MAKKPTDGPLIDCTNAPIFYADQPAALMLGAHISRLTFGVSELDGSDYPRPVVTIAIPTQSLLSLVNDLKKSFDDPEFKRDTVAALEKSAKSIASGDGKTMESVMLEQPRSRKPRQRQTND